MIWLMLTILVSLDVKGAAILASPSFTTWQTADCQYARGQSRTLHGPTGYVLPESVFKSEPSTRPSSHGGNTGTCSLHEIVFMRRLPVTTKTFRDIPNLSEIICESQNQPLTYHLDTQVLWCMVLLSLLNTSSSHSYFLGGHNLPSGWHWISWRMKLQ
jgi:hypothetical protein